MPTQKVATYYTGSARYQLIEERTTKVKYDYERWLVAMVQVVREWLGSTLLIRSSG